MSIVNINTPAGGVASGTFTLGFTPTIGNTLVLWGYIVQSTNTLTSATLGAGRGFTVLDDVVDDTYTEHMYLATRVVQSGDSSSITLVISGGSFVFYVYEVSGVLTPETSGWENVTYVRPGSGTSFNCAYTTANPNDFVLVGTRYGGSISSPSGITSGFTLNNPGGPLGATFYNPDVGAAGSKTFGWTSAFVDPRVHIYKLKAAVTDPTVSTVTQTTTSAEGGNSVHTVTLSGPTNRSTDYTAVLAGVTADINADLSNTLQTATIVGTGGAVTFVGTGNSGVFRAASGVTAFTVTLANTQDTLDEADETYTLTVSGVSGTGTILDDDSAPSIGVSDATESFGVLTFNVNMNTASGKVVTVDCGTANGTKTAGTDYHAKSVTVGFNPGDPLFKSVVVSTRPAPAAQVLRFASPYNNLTEANSVTAATTYLSVRARIPFIVGSGDFSELVLALGAWNLFGGTINFLGNAYTLDSCAFEKNGAAASVPVNFSGGRSRVVADGTAESLSDSFYASLMALANIPRGTKIWMRFQYSVASAGLKLPQGKLTVAQWGAGASAFLLTAVNDCSPVDGVGAMTATTGATNFTNPYVPIVLGKFVSGDPKTFLGLGDSILGGYLDDAVTYPQKGSFSKALTDADFLSNPIAGANFGYTGSDAALWTGTNSNMLTPYIKYAKYAVDEYQTNKIAASNGNLAAAKTGIQALWSLLAANGITVVLRTKLNPRCANGTDGTATFGAAWSTGGDALAFNDWLDTVGLGVAQGVTLHVLAMFAVRLSQTQSTESFYRWLGATVSTLGGYTSDGTHPNAAGHVLQANNFRAAFGVLN